MFKNIFCKWNEDRIEEIAKEQVKKEKARRIFDELRYNENLKYPDEPDTLDSESVELITSRSEGAYLEIPESFDLEDLGRWVQRIATHGFDRGYKKAQEKFEKKPKAKRKTTKKKKK